MRIEDAFRWQRLWWFISLDCVRGFVDDLWLRFPLTDFHFAFRQRIEVEREMPSFGHDPRSGVYSKLEWFKHTFGEPSLQYLNVWQRSIFIQGGNDGVVGQ
jgi:hypothetical protein